MTVTNSTSTSDDTLSCEWYDGKVFQSRLFHKATLKLHVPAAPPAPKEPIKFPFKEGDKVRSTTGSEGLTVGVTPPDADFGTQIPCHWTEPAKEAQEVMGKPTIPAQPAQEHVTMFWPNQLVLVESQPTEA